MEDMEVDGMVSEKTMFLHIGSKRASHHAHWCIQCFVHQALCQVPQSPLARLGPRLIAPKSKAKTAVPRATQQPGQWPQKEQQLITFLVGLFSVAELVLATVVASILM